MYCLGDVNQRIQEKLDKLEELKRKQLELEEEISDIKRDIGHALVEEDVTIKTSYVSKRLIQGNITHRFVECHIPWVNISPKMGTRQKITKTAVQGHPAVLHGSKWIVRF